MNQVKIIKRDGGTYHIFPDTGKTVFVTSSGWNLDVAKFHLGMKMCDRLVARSIMHELQKRYGNDSFPKTVIGIAQVQPEDTYYEDTGMKIAYNKAMAKKYLQSSRLWMKIGTYISSLSSDLFGKTQKEINKSKHYCMNYRKYCGDGKEGSNG